jgi:hypothetical protein
MLVVAVLFAVLSRWFVYAKDTVASGPAASLTDEEPLLPAAAHGSGGPSTGSAGAVGNNHGAEPGTG